MKFLTEYTVDLSKIPAYRNFKGIFKEELDLQLLLMKSKQKEISIATKSEVTNSIIAKMQKNKTDTHTTQYSQSYNIGRFYGNTITNYQKTIKHTLFSHLGWCDADMVKGHPSLICELGRLNGKSFPAISEYVKNPDKQFAEMTPYYGEELENHQKKWLFNLMIYGGGHKGWIDNLISPSVKDLQKGYKPIKLLNHKPRQFEIDYKKECDEIKDIIYKNNPKLVELLKKENPKQKYFDEKNINTLDMCDNMVDDKDKEKVPENVGIPVYEMKNKTISYFLQILENECLYHLYEYLVKEGVMMPKCCSLEKDGICFKPLKDIDFDEFAEDLNIYTLNKTNFRIKWKFKPYESENVDSKLIEVRKNYDFGLTENTSLNFVAEDEKYELVKEEFEAECFKIVGCDLFFRVKNRKLDMLNETSLVKGFKHINYGYGTRKSEFGEVEDRSKPLTFVNRWVADENIRKYEGYGTYPPPLVCPDDEFNTWTPFPYQDMTEEYERDEEGLQEILFFIKILCRHDDAAVKFFVQWLAHMLQFPAEKTGHFPIFVSDEGIGKGTFLKIVEKLVGKEKFLETTAPEKDVWGGFNSLMASAYFVYINEFGKKNQTEADGKIKGLLTDGNLQIECKGKDPVKITSYHRFMGSTNSEDPTEVKKGMRRKWIVRCSDELKNNRARFKTLHALIENPIVIRTFFDYLMEVECSELLGSDPPKTEYQSILEDSNVSIMEQFLKWSVSDLMECKKDIDMSNCGSTDEKRENTHTFDDVEYGGNVLIEKFNRFRKAHHISNYDNVTCAVLMKKLGLYAFTVPGNPVTKKATSKRTLTVIGWKKLATHYGIIDENECQIQL